DKGPSRIFERSLEKCLISPSTVMVERALLNQTGMFNEELLICEDYDLWLRIMLKDKAGFIPEFLINKYGGHDDQLSNIDPAMDYWRVRSLVNLTLREDLDPEKRSLILSAIQKK